MIKNILWLLRILLFYGFNAITCIICFTVSFSLILIPINYKCKYNILLPWSWAFIWSAKVIFGLKYSVTGLNNIPKKAAVIMSNHQSSWDTIIMQNLFPTQSWVLKKSILKIPLFGWAIASLQPIAIDRKDKSSIKQLITQGRNHLNNGVFVVIYPEGTRMSINRSKPFSRSGAALAIEAKSLIIPVAHNAGEFWPRGPFPKKSGTIKVVIGKPIASTNKDASRLTKEVEVWINRKRKEM